MSTATANGAGSAALTAAVAGNKPQVAGSELVDRLTAKFRDQVEKLVNEGTIAPNAVLTQGAFRIEYENGKDVEWVSTDGQVFVTRTDNTQINRPLAPFIPAGCKKIAKDPASVDQKGIAKIDDSINELFRGVFALMETSVFIKNAGAPRTLPGVAGKKYQQGRIGELQKLGDAGEKIGL